MRQARPYGDKIRNIAAHLAHANPEYRHPYLVQKGDRKDIGVLVVTSDKGLCGALNTNVLRLVTQKAKELAEMGATIQYTAIGNKALGFLQRTRANVVSHVVALGDRPHLDSLVGPVKVQIDDYISGKIGGVYIVYTRFINTMKQEPVIEQLLPLPSERLAKDDRAARENWDYVYEPDAKAVLDQLLRRYLEALIFQALAENIASEQSARMVAMKSASDNASSVIDDLTLVYNKSRQAAITKELSEIVGGAAAV
jgi:F-type H+-transporting ATPase subunit gamma